MSALGVLRKFLERPVRLGRQVARRSGAAALAGMKLAGSHTGHEQAVVFTLFTAKTTPVEAVLETKRVATGRTGRAKVAGDKVTRWQQVAR
jgi:hypothetical protein